MPIPEIDISLLTHCDSLRPDSASHCITKGRLPFSDKTWFCKEISNQIDSDKLWSRAHLSDAVLARYELLAQEFYRLIIPGQPETRVAKDFDTDRYYILSEESSGFKPLPFYKQARFTHGIYEGLGLIQVVSVFLHEIDLNLGNIGINDQGKVVKIDGDWSFASLINPDLLSSLSSEITPELLHNLPGLTDYFAYNWLDLSRNGTSFPSSDIVDDSLRSASHFREEINQALLRIILLPESYIRQFVALYVVEHQEGIVDLLLSRQRKLKSSAMDLDSFKAYLLSPEATKAADEHLNHMKRFTANDRFPVIPLEKQMLLQEEYSSLLSKCVQSLAIEVASPTRFIAPDKEAFVLRNKTNQFALACLYAQSGSFFRRSTEHEGFFQIKVAATEHSDLCRGKSMRHNRTFADLSAL